MNNGLARVTRANQLLAELGGIDILDALEELKRLRGRIDALLAHCPDPECHTCGTIICPHGEPLHFHHDGCPACAELSGEP